MTIPRRQDAGSPRRLVGAAQRLELLRRLYVPEKDSDARARLARERPLENIPFDVAAGARLRELRALCELSNYLHQARPPRPRTDDR